jgi:hypothetical protein
MLGAAEEFGAWSRATRVYAQPTKGEREARRAEAARNADMRTGPELVAAARASWAQSHREDAAA